MLKFMGKLYKSFKSGFISAMPILLFVIFILVNVAIWWIGPWFTIGETQPLASVSARLITSIVFSLFCFSIWGIMQWRKLSEIRKHQKREEILDNDPIIRMEERQETELNLVMDNMKHSLGKRNYLYALPWYLVLGVERSGKTSLINRSGQSFVFSSVMKASNKKSDNDYSFDWWISDDAVLIDPDGELLTQGYLNDKVDSQISRRLWISFIHWLEKTRSRRPLNGIVLTVDLAHLATSTESERRAYANILRSRLRELMETLSTRLPVYISFTKFDLLHGFEPFFRTYSKEARDEILGFTFSLNSVDDLDHWLSEYTQRYDELVTRVRETLPYVLVSLTDHEEKKAVYTFMRQLAGLKDSIYRLLEEMLASDQFSTSALVRGIYFNSVFQQGVPINAFDNATSRRYGLIESINPAQKAKNSVMFFTSKLFTNIIYPEAGLASDSFRVTKQKKRILMTSVLTCSIAMVLLIIGWQRYYQINTKQANNVLSKVTEYQQQISGEGHLLTEKDVIDPLNKIREATLEFGFYRERSKYFSNLGLYQGYTIGPEVEETYLNLLETKFLPMLMADAVSDLRKAENDAEELNVLRVYQMLVDKSGRYPEIVLDYFSKSWQQRYPAQNIIQQDLLAHLDYAMKHTDLRGDRLQGSVTAENTLRPYDNLIAKSQQKLGRMPNAERVYSNLKLNARALLGPPTNMRNLIGPVFDIVYRNDQEETALDIPKLLTREGYNEYFTPQSDSISKLALIDSWVLGQSKTADFSEEDKRRLREDIRQLYVADYTTTWRRVLNNVEIKKFEDINDAVLVFDSIIGSLEPLQRLLRTVDNNTDMLPPLPDDSLAKEQLLKSPHFRVSSMISAPFADLNELSKEQGDNPAYITEVTDAIIQLHAYLKAIEDAPNVGLSALNATKERVELQSVDPIYTVQRISNGLPEPLNRLTRSLSDQAWFVVKQEAIKHLEVRWQQDVYRFYQEKLAGRYPFSSNSRIDVALEDFEEFFAPDGILETFYNEQLKLFLDENIVNTREHGSIVKKKVLEDLAQAKKIQSAFFNRKGMLDVKFSLKPILLTSNKRRSVLDVDGQYLPYSHGKREEVSLIWPNSLRDLTSSKITLVPTLSSFSPRSISRQGTWSFFRLLDTADIISVGDKTVDYKFTLDNGSMTYRLQSSADVSPFTQNLFRSFNLSENLY